LLGGQPLSHKEAVVTKQKTTQANHESEIEKSKSVPVDENTAVDEDVLFSHVAGIIENRKTRAAAYVNQEVTLMYWEIGCYLNDVVLGEERAERGKRIVATLSPQLSVLYGRSFEKTNLYRMIRFARAYPEVKLIEKLSTQLSWSHFVGLLAVKNIEARAYYANDAVERRLGVRAMRQQIARKTYERREIANHGLSDESVVPFNIFKDPFILDTLDLKDNYYEADLEKAILIELKAFILEFGNGFGFIESQKRMTMDGDDFILDLLFYNRNLKRLVAIELKLGKFKPAYKGQMDFYLRWLDRFERSEGEEAPIGIILCTTASREQVEFMELDKSGIAVAEYWTTLPPKVEFERRIRGMVQEARERLERRKSMPKGEVQKQLDYYFEEKDDE
jgi:predicted nuclease of restriction endonuclease-like (RecB) superfamily